MLRKNLVVLFMGAFVFCYSEDVKIPSQFVSNLYLETAQRNVSVINSGAIDYDMLKITLSGSESKKYNLSIRPGMIVFIQKDDPGIDLMNVIQLYMKKLQEKLNASGLKLSFTLPQIKNYKDQILTSYEFSADNKLFYGVLFVGKKDGYLVISYCSVTDDLFGTRYLDFLEILESIRMGNE